MPGQESMHPDPQQEAVRQEQQDARSLLAGRFFIQASTEYPTSVVFQGGRIAQLCRARNVQPSPLGQALVADDIRMQQLIRTAGAVHQRRGLDLTIRIEHAKNIVEGGFEWAEQLIALSPDTLAAFLQSFEDFQTIKESLGIGLAEQVFRVKAADLLAEEE